MGRAMLLALAATLLAPATGRAGAIEGGIAALGSALAATENAAEEDPAWRRLDEAREALGQAVREAGEPGQEVLVEALLAADDPRLAHECHLLVDGAGREDALLARARQALAGPRWRSAPCLLALLDDDRRDAVEGLAERLASALESEEPLPPCLGQAFPSGAGSGRARVEAVAARLARALRATADPRRRETILRVAMPPRRWGRAPTLAAALLDVAQTTGDPLAWNAMLALDWRALVVPELRARMMATLQDERAAPDVRHRAWIVLGEAGPLRDEEVAAWRAFGTWREEQSVFFGFAQRRTSRGGDDSSSSGAPLPDVEVDPRTLDLPARLAGPRAAGTRDELLARFAALPDGVVVPTDVARALAVVCDEVVDGEMVAAVLGGPEARALGAVLVLELARRPALADALAACPDDAPEHTRALATALAPRPIGVSAADAAAMVGPVVRRLRVDPADRVRCGAALWLGNALPEATAEAALVAALEADPSPRVQEACAVELRDAASAEARAALVRVLREARADPGLRAAARRTLASLAPLEPAEVEALR